MHTMVLQIHVSMHIKNNRSWNWSQVAPGSNDVHTRPFFIKPRDYNVASTDPILRPLPILQAGVRETGITLKFMKGNNM